MCENVICALPVSVKAPALGSLMARLQLVPVRDALPVRSVDCATFAVSVTRTQALPVSVAGEVETVMAPTARALIVTGLLSSTREKSCCGICETITSI